MYISLYFQEDILLCEADRSQWVTIFSELRDTLRHAARLCVRSGRIQEEELEKYFVSGTAVDLLIHDQIQIIF